MSRTAWRALFGLLRNNWYFWLFGLVVAHLTVDIAGMASRLHGLVVPCAMIWCVFALFWPLILCMAPPAREFMLLPLSARETGGLVVVLRIAVPTVALLAMALVQFALRRASTAMHALPTLPPHVALQMCAAFPLLVLAPFLPMPSFMSRDRDPSYQGGRPAARAAACIAILLVAPCIAIAPVLAHHDHVAVGWALPALLWCAFAALAWGQRERLVIESFHGGDKKVIIEVSAGPRGWRGLAPLLIPGLAWAGAVGIFMPLLLLPLRHALSDRDFAAGLVSGEFAFAGSCVAFASYVVLQKSIRPLRQLPIHSAILSLLMMAGISVPPLVGLVLSLAVIAGFRPNLHLPLAHIAALWLFCIACTSLILAPAVCFGRSRTTALCWLPTSWLIWFVASGIYLTHLHLPSDLWLFAVAAALLCGSYVWLEDQLRNSLVKQVIPR